MKLNDPLTPAPTVVAEATQAMKALVAAQRQNQRLLKLSFPGGDGPGGVICEIMKDDGTMARLPDLQVFAREHGLKIGTIADLIATAAATKP